MCVLGLVEPASAAYFGLAVGGDDDAAVVPAQEARVLAGARAVEDFCAHADCRSGGVVLHKWV